MTRNGKEQNCPNTGKGACFLKKWLIVPLLAFVLLCISCNSETAKKETGAKETESTVTEEAGPVVREEKNISEDVSGQKALSDIDKKKTEPTSTEEGADMNTMDIITLVGEKLSGGSEAFTAEAESVTDSKGRCFIRLAVTPGREEAADSWLAGFAGKGHDGANRKMPAFDNEVCERLRQMTPVKAYSIFRQGENGVKTSSTEIMTAQDGDGNMHIFILGT